MTIILKGGGKIENIITIRSFGSRCLEVFISGGRIQNNPLREHIRYFIILNSYKMLNFNGHPLHFVSYDKISERNPKFVAQTGVNEYGNCLCIWQVGNQYFICVA